MGPSHFLKEGFYKGRLTAICGLRRRYLAWETKEEDYNLQSMYLMLKQLIQIQCLPVPHNYIMDVNALIVHCFVSIYFIQGLLQLIIIKLYSTPEHTFDLSIQSFITIKICRNHISINSLIKSTFQFVVCLNALDIGKI